ncbi:hypothetical protein [Streptomyces sp. NRRL S-244]|uniref:hypothetical protein n=1 Tax=Streptomyces sp. NRRL S-244 TaxID=1463897 RepID=UPI0004BE9DDC|nr:hypothetical protein [Streptomyces sp. NRRL S-244]
MADDLARQASKARAAQLREQIRQLMSKARPGTATTEPSSGESPRDFVHRRMQETASEAEQKRARQKKPAERKKAAGHGSNQA